MTKRQLMISILLTLFVMPGSGHMYLKKKKRATIYMVVVMVVMFAFIGHLYSVIWAEMQALKPVANDLPQMFAFVTALTTDIMVKYDLLIRFYVFLFGVSYIVAITDLCWIYYTPRSKSKAAQAKQ